MSKGSGRRPADIDEETECANWERTFGVWCRAMLTFGGRELRCELRRSHSGTHLYRLNEHEDVVW